MRPIARPLLAVALAVSLASCHKSHTPEGPRVTILFTTDEHSHLFAVAPEVDDFDLASGTIKTAVGTGKLRGGIARRATILEAERAAAAGRGSEGTLTFSAGDYSQGSLSAAAHLMTAPDLRALKLLKYDAVAIGNHEFDVGPGGLALSISRAGAANLPPLVLTNVVIPAGNPLEAVYGAANAIAPSRVITLPSGRKIGVVAVIGPGAQTAAAGATPVTFRSATPTDPMAGTIALVQPVVNALRADPSISSVIVLGHGGIGPRLTAVGGIGPGDDELLAQGLSGVDLVISGHSHSQGMRVAVAADGRHVPIIQPAPYGDQVGRVDLIFDGSRPVLDPAQTAFIPVDDRTPPTSDAAINGLLGATIGLLENGLTGVIPAFLPPTLQAVMGATAPAHGTLGDLYYAQIGKTDFDVRGLGGGESNAMNLGTDAMLATARGLVTTDVTEVALQNYGSIRGDLLKGATGALSFADVYRIVPNGVDPSNTTQKGTPGFPLIRVGLYTIALRAALEGTLAYSALDGDYFLGGSGIEVHYDKTRKTWDKSTLGEGWITTIDLVDTTTSPPTKTRIYDVSQTQSWTFLVNGTPVSLPTHFVVSPFSVRKAVTTYYVGLFAQAFGVTLLKPDGTALTSLDDAVLTWDGTATGPHVKDHQALGRYVYFLTCPGAFAPTPTACTSSTFTSLPAIYDASTTAGKVPRRMVCEAGLCP